VCLIIGVAFSQLTKVWLLSAHPELRRKLRSVERRARHNIEGGGLGDRWADLHRPMPRSTLHSVTNLSLLTRPGRDAGDP
jgi:hypothetical protein